jgi:phosphonate transport system ATP-binding protein
MLALESLEVAYPGGIKALRPTTLTFREGEFAVLLGPSGAGKSTLLRCLNGLVRPTNGRVSAPGVGDIAASRATLRRHRAVTGMVFQHHHLIGRLTALANVLMGRLGHQSTLRSLWPPSRSDQRFGLEALERVDLLDRALTRVDLLSGGQQQRVGIARAVAQRPRLILADEPVASLDPATATRVLDLLRSICRTDGMSAVVSLHQVDLARHFADRVVGVRGGEVVFDGPPARLCDGVLSRIYGARPAEVSVDIVEAPRARRAAIYASRTV